MSSAVARGWGGQWPSCPYGLIVTLVRKDGLRLALHRDLVQLVAVLMDKTEAMGYDIRPDWTWSFACRNIAGTRVASNHSSGTAVDINAPRNPMGSRSWHAARAGKHRPFGLAVVTDIPERVIRLWEEQNFRWGGRYTRPDTMHFEFMGTPAEAKRRNLALRSTHSVPAPVPAPRPKYDDYYEENEMKLPAMLVQAKGKAPVWVTDGITKQHVRHPDHMNILLYLGIAQASTNNKPFQWTAAAVDSIRTV